MKIHAILLHGLIPYLKEKPCSSQGLEAKAIKENKLKSDQPYTKPISGHLLVILTLGEA